MRKIAIAFGVALGVSAACWGREFRRLRTIPTPARLPKGAKPLEKPEPVKSQTIKEVVKDTLKSWNRPDLAEKLGDAFYDKQRLLESISEKAPRDAKIRIMGIQNLQVLSQFAQRKEDGSSEIVSRVSAIVRTQIEYRDPQEGFQRIEGLNEYIFEIRTEPGASKSKK